MAIKGVSITVMYTALDTVGNAGKTGDVLNHTLRLIQDGVANVPTNAPGEVDAANCPGVYKLLLTAGETNYDTITLAGKSSTPNVVIIPTHVITEHGDLALVPGLVWDVPLAAHLIPGSTGFKLNSLVLSGSGSIQFIYTLTDSITMAPIDAAHIWITSDVAGVNVVASGYTDSLGNVTVYLDPGTYYFWRQKNNYIFANPDIETVV